MKFPLTASCDKDADLEELEELSIRTTPRAAQRRLVRIEPAAVAFVDRAANLHRYLIRKRKELGMPLVVDKDTGWLVDVNKAASSGDRLDRAAGALERLLAAIEQVTKAEEPAPVSRDLGEATEDAEAASGDLERQAVVTTLKQIASLATQLLDTPEDVAAGVAELLKLIKGLVPGECEDEDEGDEVTPAVSEEVADKAVWSTAYVNDLPDSAFLYVESGGEKDSEGKTTPRSLRHFPYKDADGKVDLPHLRNAIARIPQSKVPGLSDADKERLQNRARAMLDRAQAKSDDSATEGGTQAEEQTMSEKAAGAFIRTLQETVKRAADLNEQVTKAEMQAEIDQLKALVATLQGLVEKHKETTKSADIAHEDMVALFEANEDLTALQALLTKAAEDAAAAAATTEEEKKPEVEAAAEAEVEATETATETEETETESETEEAAPGEEQAKDVDGITGTQGVTLADIAAKLEMALTELTTLKSDVAKARTTTQSSASAGIDAGADGEEDEEKYLFPQNYNDPAVREARKKRGLA